MNKFGRLKKSGYNGNKKTNVRNVSDKQLEKLVELYRSEQIVISLILDYIIEKFNIDKEDLDKYVKEKITFMLNNMNDNIQQTETDNVTIENVEDVENEDVKN
jgi:hypothetical protein